LAPNPETLYGGLEIYLFYFRFDANAPFTATTVGITTKLPRQPYNEWTLRNKNLACLYAGILISLGSSCDQVDMIGIKLCSDQVDIIGIRLWSSWYHWHQELWSSWYHCDQVVIKLILGIIGIMLWSSWYHWDHVVIKLISLGSCCDQVDIIGIKLWSSWYHWDQVVISWYHWDLVISIRLWWSWYHWNHVVIKLISLGSSWYHWDQLRSQ
jgi:hypothetical protein